MDTYKAHIKIAGFKLEFTGLSHTAAVLVFSSLLLIFPAMLYVGFLLTRWAVLELAGYTITGWQYVAAVVILSFISSFFKRD